MNPTVIQAYLDTCIVSGWAKGDIAPAEEIALLRILQARKTGRVELVTSEVTLKEISAIPEQFRSKHSVIYGLLDDLRTAPTHRSNSMLMLGVGGGRRQHWLLTALKELLRDEGDANHVFQAARSSIKYLVTVDRKTLISKAPEIETLCGVSVVSPSELVELAGLTHDA